MSNLIRYINQDDPENDNKEEIFRGCLRGLRVKKGDMKIEKAELKHQQIWG